MILNNLKSENDLFLLGIINNRLIVSDGGKLKIYSSNQDNYKLSMELPLKGIASKVTESNTSKGFILSYFNRNPEEFSFNEDNSFTRRDILEGSIIKYFTSIYKGYLGVENNSLYFYTNNFEKTEQYKNVNNNSIITRSGYVFSHSDLVLKYVRTKTHKVNDLATLIYKLKPNHFDIHPTDSGHICCIYDGDKIHAYKLEKSSIVKLGFTYVDEECSYPKSLYIFGSKVYVNLKNYINVVDIPTVSPAKDAEAFYLELASLVRNKDSIEDFEKKASSLIKAIETSLSIERYEQPYRFRELVNELKTSIL